MFKSRFNILCVFLVVNMGFAVVSSQSSLIPLHRYFNGRNGDHFYTTSWEELGGGRGGYGYEGVACKLPQPGSYDGTVPLHRYYNSRNGDHFYTSSWNELGGGRGGYKYEGVQGQIFPNQEFRTIPLHRYYNSKSGDHFYTTNWEELGGGRGRYRYEGIAGYCFAVTDQCEVLK